MRRANSGILWNSGCGVEFRSDQIKYLEINKIDVKTGLQTVLTRISHEENLNRLKKIRLQQIIPTPNASIKTVCYGPVILKAF